MYESYFGLNAKPFQLNPDPAFYFASRGHKRAMAYLEYGLHQSEGFIVITGEVGAGKTTLVRQLLQQLDQQKVVAAQLVSTHLDAEDMLRMVSAAFGLKSKRLDKADILLGLEMFLVSLTAVGKRALLIVDEAQNLTPRAVEELRMLSNFQLGEHALLQSFLVGQPEFRNTMQSDQMQQLRQRVIASYHLGPMDADETQSYIMHRLHHVGWKNDPTIEAAAFRGIYEHTQGIPRRVNTLCDRILLGAFLGGKHDITADDVKEVTEELREEEQVGPMDQLSGGVDIDLSDVPVPVVAPTPELKVLAGFNPSGLKVDPGTAARARKLAEDFQVGGLEERIARLEKSLAATLSLMQDWAKAAGETEGKKRA